MPALGNVTDARYTPVCFVGVAVKVFSASPLRIVTVGVTPVQRRAPVLEHGDVGRSTSRPAPSPSGVESRPDGGPPTGERRGREREHGEYRKSDQQTAHRAPPFLEHPAYTAPDPRGSEPKGG